MPRRWLVGAACVAGILRVGTTATAGGDDITAEASRPLHRIGHGYAWLPNPDTQLDVSLGLGLSAAAPDFFLGFGFSRRF